MILIYIFFIFFTQVKGILTEHQVVVIIKHCEFCAIFCVSHLLKQNVNVKNHVSVHVQHSQAECSSQNSAACLAAQCLPVDGSHM